MSVNTVDKVDSNQVMHNHYNIKYSKVLYIITVYNFVL